MPDTPWKKEGGGGGKGRGGICKEKDDRNVLVGELCGPVST